jgi:hypothetical protein
LSTNQPKCWHLTFDGHLLLACVKSFGGLADKSDERIEKGHQEWKRLQDRFRRIQKFEKRQKCIMKAWRRRRHHSIILAIEEFKSKRTKHGCSSHRAKDESRREESRRKGEQEGQEGGIHLDD